MSDHNNDVTFIISPDEYGVTVKMLSHVTLKFHGGCKCYLKNADLAAYNAVVIDNITGWSAELLLTVG